MMWLSVLLSSALGLGSGLGLEYAKRKGWLEAIGMPPASPASPATGDDSAADAVIVEVMGYLTTGAATPLAPRVDKAVRLMRTGQTDIVERNLRVNDPVARSIARVVLALPAFYWEPGAKLDPAQVEQQLQKYFSVAPEAARQKLAEAMAPQTAGHGHDHACGPGCHCDDCSGSPGAQASADQITSEMAADVAGPDYDPDEDDPHDSLVGAPDYDPSEDDLLSGPDYDPNEDLLAGPDYDPEEDDVSGPDYDPTEDLAGPDYDPDEDLLSGPDYEPDEDYATGSCITGRCG